MDAAASPAVAGAPRVLLRLEGLGLGALAIALYAYRGSNWWLFALFLLTPDLSFAGYLFGPRIGSLIYNAAHTTIGPILLAGFGAWLSPPLISLALIWAAHIGIDRLLGYGLKYPASFRFTHLGEIGTPGIRNQ